MLNKKNERNSSNTNEINFIAKGVKTKGELNCTNDLRYDGFLEGTLNVQAKLVLGAESHVKGTVYAINADISGTIEGNIEIKETLTMRASAKIIGDIKTNKIIIEHGADFNGTCTMNDKALTVEKKTAIPTANTTN
jgi:cytoskeletal protein CcmA (bactofilin family)